MDGLKIPIQPCGECKLQNACCNGWLPCNFVGCMFVFALNGTVVAASVNNPRSKCDGFTAENSGIYNKLEQDDTVTGGKCIIDAAFSL